MKTFKLILAAALLCAAQNGLKAQTAVIGPADQYAFQWDNGSGATSLGLFFNATQNRYEFRDISGTSKFHLNPVSNRATFNTNVGIGVENPNQALMVDGNTQLGTPTGTDYAQFNSQGDLSFEGAGDYLVGSNRYAFRASANENYGLFFNASNFRYEFRDGTASPAFYIDAQTGEIVSTTNLRIGNSSTNIPGNIRFNGTDFEGFVGGSWQSLTSGGGGGGTDDQTISLSGTTLSIEDGNSIDLSSIDTDTDTDDQTLSLSGTLLSIDDGNTVDLSAIAGVDGDWNYTGSDIYSGVGHNVGVGTSTPGFPLHVEGLTRIESDASLASGGALSLGKPGFYKSIHLNQWDIQSYSSGLAGGPIAVNAYGGDVVLGNTNSDLTVSSGTFFVDGSANKVGIGVTTPSARLHVLGDVLSTSANIFSLVNYSGTVDVRGVEASSVTADGYGIGVQGTGGWRGVYGVANGGTYTGQVYGVSGTASGDGTPIGVYGSAFSGSGTAWAGYFSGNTYVSGNMMIGTTNGATGYKLSVDGKIIAEELHVELSTAWPDYVFEEDYELAPLSDVAEHIQEHGHLPGIPSAQEIDENGHDMGEMQRRMMEKIEELTLYVIELENKTVELQSELDQLNK